MKQSHAFLITAFMAFSFFTRAQMPLVPELLLTPETSAFTKTSTYQDVNTFLQRIEQLSDQVHLFSMGKSLEGKDIPVAILANRKITTPEEARASGKLVVYVQGNIHAGEVEGKEVVMMLIRDILLGQEKHLLDNQVLIFVPIYNTDSNDKMEKGRRPSQEDSPLEVGIRENSQGLDLNRDGVKLEALETKALFTQVINRWDPHVFIDLHTTNGTWHAYSLTWAPSYHSAGERSLYEFTKNKLLQHVTASVKEKYDLSIGPFGDYSLREGWPAKNFYTYNHHPRYLVNQFGLRNRIGILSEAFAHERFYQRIHSTYAFVSEMLSFTNEHAAELKNATKNAEEAAVRLVTEYAGTVKKGVRFKMVSNEILNNFKTYDYLQVSKPDGPTEWIRTGKIIMLDSVKYFASFEPVIESTLPRGYIIPAAHAHIARHLQMLGVKVEQLQKAATFTGEVFRIEKLNHASRKFEGHFMASVEGKFIPATRRFTKGDYIVDLAQPLANLIFYVLEPQSDDGLVTWNFFDDYLKKAGIENKPVEYPVFKYLKGR